MDHFLLMVCYSALVSAFLALLWRRRPRRQLAFGLKVFVGMVAGSLALAWVLYFIPPGPPPMPLAP